MSMKVPGSRVTPSSVSSCDNSLPINGTGLCSLMASFKHCVRYGNLFRSSLRKKTNKKNKKRKSKQTIEISFWIEVELVYYMYSTLLRAQQNIFPWFFKHLFPDPICCACVLLTTLVPHPVCCGARGWPPVAPSPGCQGVPPESTASRIWPRPSCRDLRTNIYRSCLFRVRSRLQGRDYKIYI